MMNKKVFALAGLVMFGAAGLNAAEPKKASGLIAKVKSTVSSVGNYAVPLKAIAGYVVVKSVVQG